MPIPTEDLRSNIGTWAVGISLLPAVTRFMVDCLPKEEYDPYFNAQPICTTYFDTKDFNLRKARTRKDKYIVIRVRDYPGATTALSVKTENEKFRVEVTTTDIETLIDTLPANLH